MESLGLTRRSLLLTAAAAGGAVLLAGCDGGKSPAPFHSVDITGAEHAQQLQLPDADGRLRSLADFKGKVVVLFFGYVHCPDVCPITMGELAQVKKQLGTDGERIQGLFVTVDPARDTVDVLAEYVAAFHPQLIGLTGTEAQVAEAADNFRVWYERSEDAAAPDGYLMAHSGYIYLMRPDGDFDSVYREGDQPPEALAEEILMRIERDERT